MTLSNFDVVRVMSWCDLNAAGTKLLIYMLVCSNRDLTVGLWQLQHLSNNILVTVIIRIDSNCSIT